MSRTYTAYNRLHTPPSKTYSLNVNDLQTIVPVTAHRSDQTWQNSSKAGDLVGLGNFPHSNRFFTDQRFLSQPQTPAGRDANAAMLLFYLELSKIESDEMTKKRRHGAFSFLWCHRSRQLLNICSSGEKESWMGDRCRPLMTYRFSKNHVESIHLGNDSLNVHIH